MRWLYTLFWALVLPLVFLYLCWRAIRQPEYLRHWGERLGGLRLAAEGREVIWVHAVSVGETRASEPLIRTLMQRYPAARILLTHVTPTGRAAGRELFGDSLTQAYLPYDFPWFCARFLKTARPRLGIVMETEIWPNLFQACRRRDIPLYLVNCRLSARSADGYGRFPALVRPALACLSGIAAQTEADAGRLRALGAERVQVTGNLKFDVTPAPSGARQATELRRMVGDARFVWLAASTRDGEERIILDAWRQLNLPDLFLVIVPRHPQRFDEVARMIRAEDPAMIRRSATLPATPETRIMLGDSMGEMGAYYALCDIAFIGGSLLPFGGQNLIEAAAAGKPVLIGPHTWNFEAAAQAAIDAGAAFRIADGAGLGAAVGRLHGDAIKRQQMCARGLAFASVHQGATRRILDVMAPALGTLTSVP
jgi:3-deoxy-D-manno-octulosonic-acid transferase